MKLLVSKVTINEGLSKKRDPNGAPYKIASLTHLVQFEPYSWNKESGSGSCIGCGVVEREIQVHPDALPQFKKFEGQYPLELELETETEQRGNTINLVVVGCKLPSQIKAA